MLENLRVITNWGRAGLIFYYFLLSFIFFNVFLFFVFSFIFVEKMEKWSSYGYSGASFKLAKYQHLELILRENKLTYTKLILNEADSGTKIRIEPCKEKNVKCTYFTADTLQSYVRCTSILQPAVNRQPGFRRGDS